MRHLALILLALAIFAATGCDRETTAQMADDNPVPEAKAKPAMTEEQLQAKIESMYQEDKKGFPEIKDITPEALMKQQATEGDNTLLVDTRDAKEQAVSIIPGAILFQDFEKKPEAYKDRPIVFYCTIGTRSGYATQKYGKLGYDATNLKGSVLSWAHAGGKFVTPDGEPTKRVHVYDEPWSLLPEGYEPVW